jgi:hypothetical protein
MDQIGFTQVGKRQLRSFQNSCAGYLAYPFQNQEVNSHAGNLNTTYLMRRLPRKRTGRAIFSTLFWNGYAK